MYNKSKDISHISSKKISRRAARSKLKKAQREYLVVGRNQVKIKKSPDENISLWLVQRFFILQRSVLMKY